MTRRLAVFVVSPKFQLWLNMVFGCYFLAMIPVALYSGLKKSVPFLVTISLWALVAAHWSSALAAYAAKVGKENPQSDSE